MENFSDLLQRFRLCKEDRYEGTVVKEKPAPAKRRNVPFSASLRRTVALTRVRPSNEAKTLAEDAADAKDASPLHLCAPQTENNSQFSGQLSKAPATHSAFASSANSLPPLLQDTIGNRLRKECLTKVPPLPTPGTAARRAAAAASGAFSCVVVDLETTGFNANVNEIIEVGCVELRWNPPQTWCTPKSLGNLDCRPYSSMNTPTDFDGFWARGSRQFHRYIRPSSPAAFTAAATTVHGITWGKVKDCNEWPVVARELASFMHQITMDNMPAPSALQTNASLSQEAGDILGCAQLLAVQLPPLVAHNASFDASFLERHFQSCGYYVVWDVDYPLTCSMKWSRKAYPHVAPNLNSICRFMGIDGAEERATGYHGAMIDAALTAKLFLRLCQRWEESNVIGAEQQDQRHEYH